MRSLTFAVLALGLALLVVSCAPDGGSAPLTGTLSDAQLDELAADAWSEAALPGDPTPVTTTNADPVGTGAVQVLDSGLDDATLAAGMVLSFGATGGLTLPSSTNAIENGTRVTLKSSLQPTAGTTYNVSGTYACPGDLGGTLTVTGSVIVSIDQSVQDGVVVSGTIQTRAVDLLLRFDACANAQNTRRLWGTVLINTDNRVAVAPQPGAPGVYDITLDVDESAQAGLAIEFLDTPGTYFGVTVRYARSGHVDAVSDTNVQPADLTLNGSLVSTVLVNGITCTRTVSFDETGSHLVKTCEAAP
jgi:hypothetical protein